MHPKTTAFEPKVHFNPWIFVAAKNKTKKPHTRQNPLGKNVFSDGTTFGDTAVMEEARFAVAMSGQRRNRKRGVSYLV